MKKLTLILSLIFTVTLSSPSYAEWTKVGENVYGKTFYVDFEGIRKDGGYVYFWYLINTLKPDKWGDFSSKTYSQGKCDLSQYKWLDKSYHTQPMGEGTPSTTGVSEQAAKKLRYPPPNSVMETVLKKVCSR